MTSIMQADGKPGVQCEPNAAFADAAFSNMMPRKYRNSDHWQMPSTLDDFRLLVRLLTIVGRGFILVALCLHRSALCSASYHDHA